MLHVSFSHVCSHECYLLTVWNCLWYLWIWQKCLNLAKKNWIWQIKFWGWVAHWDCNLSRMQKFQRLEIFKQTTCILPFLHLHQRASLHLHIWSKRRMRESFLIRIYIDIDILIWSRMHKTWIWKHRKNCKCYFYCQVFVIATAGCSQ